MAGPTPRASRLRALALPLALALAGLLLNFHPTLLSGFRRMQTDPGDARVTNYALEHAWRWTLRDPAHPAYWDPPVYHPAREQQALLGGGLGSLPLYAPWRLLGGEPDSAFQGWLLLVALANFAAFQRFLADGLRLPPLSAATGAFLFAFGLPRANTLHHPQFAPAYFAALALWALARALRPGEARAGRFAAAFFALWGAQLWCGLALFWFFSLALLVALAWALAAPAARTALRALVAGRALPLAGGMLAFAGLTAAPLLHAARALRALALPPGVAGYALLPRIHSWLNAGPSSWLWGWLFRHAPFSALTDEHRLGLGLLTFALVCWGLRRREGPVAAILARTALSLIALATVFPVNLSLWSLLCAFAPGARAVPRVSMIALILLIPAACGIAWAVERLGARRSAPVLAALLFAVIAEQGSTTWSYDKLTQRADVARIEQAVPPACRAFLVTGDNPAHYEVSFKYHTDAMLASLRLGMPTLNGPYGAAPAEMKPFASVLVPDAPAQQRTRALIAAHAARTGLSANQVCWIHVTQPLDW